MARSGRTRSAASARSGRRDERLRSARVRPGGARRGGSLDLHPPERAGRLGWWMLVAAFASIPAVFHRNGTVAFDLPKATLLYVAVTVATCAWIAWCLGRRRWTPRPQIGLAVLALVVFTVAATAFSESPWVSLLGATPRYDGLITQVTVVAFGGLVLAYTWERPLRLRVLMVAGALGALADAGYVLAQELGLDFPWSSVESGETPAAFGTLGNPNFSGGHIAIALPFTLWLWRRVHGWLRVLITTMAVLELAGLWFTDNRSGLIAAAAGVAVAGLVDLRKGDGHLLGKVPTALTSVGAGAGLALVLVTIVTSSTAWAGPLSDSFLLRSQTLEQRVDIWRGSVDMIIDHPLLGTGPDAFELVFSRYSPADLSTRPQPIDEAHNVFLDRAATTGIGALLAFGAVLWITARNVARSARDSESVGLTAVLAGSLAAYITQGLFSIDVATLSMLCWSAIAGLASLTDPALARARQAGVAPAGPDGEASTHQGEAASAGRAPLLVTVGLSGIALAVSVAASIPLVADVRLRRATDTVQQVAQGQAEPEAAFAAMERAIDTQPASPYIRYVAATTIDQLGTALNLFPDETLEHRRWALPQIERAIELAPGDVEVELARATILRNLALLGETDRWAEADAIYLRLETDDPFNPKVHIERANHLAVWAANVGRSDLAGLALEETDLAADTANDTWASVWHNIAELYAHLGQREKAAEAANRALKIDPDHAGALEVLAELRSAPAG